MQSSTFPRCKVYLIPASLMAIALASVVGANTITVIPAKDNTLIEDPLGLRSNALSDGIFSGRIGSMGGGLRQRAVLKFNLAAIPPGSTITSATLAINLVQGHGGSQAHNLHRVLADWGEGTSMALGGTGAPSTPGDATWIHRFYPNVFWSQIGGDFSATSSGSANIGNTGGTSWSGAGMITDVQFWVNNPSSNFGWLIKGNENTLGTAKKIQSTNSFTENERPRLTVIFTPPPPPPCIADINQDHVVDVNDLLIVLNSWGPCPGSPCPADIHPPAVRDEGGGIAGNGYVNVDDLLTVINSWGPCP